VLYAPPVSITRLPTPAAIVDLDAFERNCNWMRARVAERGAVLRPHVKTHKTVEGALLQCGGKPSPITVSTLAEARLFSAAGFSDITYAVPIPPAKLPAVAELLRGGTTVNLLLDNESMRAEMEAFATAQDVRLPIFLKVDCGYHRAGVDPVGEEGMSLALQVAQSECLNFRGVLTHAGHAYHCRSPREVLGVARQERDVTVAFAARLRAAGAEVCTVSIGSTPTISVVDELAGVTEVRPGNYAFFDAYEAAIGACRLDDCAFTVLATVIGSYPERRRLLIDAGALALSKDEGARHLDDEFGYGAVFSVDRSRHFWELRVTSLSQEHGEVTVNPPRTVAEFPIGTTLRIVPNHSCLAAALFDHYHAVRGLEVVDVWRPVRGW
jgi:D-serine deaminase-like pyridoxal phosphate-dependent protein